MLFSRSRSVVFLAAALLPAAILVTGCSKKQAKPEVRLARSGAVNSGAGFGADGSSTAFAPGSGWSPLGAPSEGGLGASGSMNMLGAGGSGALGAGQGVGLDETGSFMNTANMDGIEMAQFAAELEMIHFEYDSAEIPDQWKPVLDGHAQWINSKPGLMVQIEGHCDERGTEEYNMSLGQRRADMVRNYLIERGVDGNRLATISYGKMRPLAFDETQESLALNRRAMFLVYQAGATPVAQAGGF
jgi:peptidoglycan-associated lipoprotein